MPRMALARLLSTGVSRPVALRPHRAVRSKSGLIRIRFGLLPRDGDAKPIVQITVVSESLAANSGSVLEPSEPSRRAFVVLLRAGAAPLRFCPDSPGCPRARPTESAFQNRAGDYAELWPRLSSTLFPRCSFHLAAHSFCQASEA